MKKSRIKNQTPLNTIATRTDAENVMHELALAANNKRTLMAQLDAAILKLQEDAAANIARHDEAIADKSDALRTWAQANPDEFSRGKKSISLLSGTLGFRTGTPKLALLSRTWDWEKVLGHVQQLLPDYIRRTPQLDKEAILNRRDELAIQLALPHVGLKVVQDEAFFVEPRSTGND